MEGQFARIWFRRRYGGYALSETHRNSQLGEAPADIFAEGVMGELRKRLARAFRSDTALFSLEGTTPSAGQTPLPDDLEQAAFEQVAYWFRYRDKTGLIRSWPHDGTYEAFLQSDLLLEVRAVLKKYVRWNI